MRWLLLLTLLACKSSEHKQEPPAQVAASAPVSADSKAPKPPDEMDEKMRHCPLALEGTTSTLEDVAGGVRFTIKAPEPVIAEARRRAHHVVEFAARKTREGHGDFDGKGGGRMKNCPVVTDEVTITATDIDGGAQLDIVSASNRVEALRTETRERVKKFPFTGATITLATGG